MKISFVEPHLRLYGGIRRIIELSNRLVLRGHDVTIFHSDGSPCKWLKCTAKIKSYNMLLNEVHDVVIFNDPNPIDYRLVKKAKAKIKILYVIENIDFGGGERNFAQIINGLDKSRYSVFVVCGRRNEFLRKIQDSAMVFDFSFRGVFSVFKINKLAKIIKEHNINIVHSQGGRADFFTRLAAKIAKVKKVITTIAMPV